MFNPNLLRMACNEFSNEAWIPEFTGNAEVLAAAHKSIGLAALDGGWYTFRREVILFATSN